MTDQINLAEIKLTPMAPTVTVGEFAVRQQSLLAEFVTDYDFWRKTRPVFYPEKLTHAQFFDTFGAWLEERTRII